MLITKLLVKRQCEHSYDKEKENDGSQERGYLQLVLACIFFFIGAIGKRQSIFVDILFH